VDKVKCVREKGYIVYPKICLANSSFSNNIVVNKTYAIDYGLMTLAYLSLSY